MLRAGLPPEEPISQWLADPGTYRLQLRAGDHALLIGAVEYRVLPGGLVEVKDYTDPRSMRYQRYDPAHPGQPYMEPSVEDDTLPRR